MFTPILKPLTWIDDLHVAIRKRLDKDLARGTPPFEDGRFTISKSNSFRLPSSLAEMKRWSID